MTLVLRGRSIEPEDLEMIRALIAAEGPRGRCYISRELCRRWNWTRPNGALKDAACRALLLGLEDRGLIELPPRQRGVIHGRPQGRGPRHAELALVEPAGADMGFPNAISWRSDLRGEDDLLYKSLLDGHHYLGYQRPVGQTLRYLAFAHDRPVAALGWAAAAQKVASRDRFIGWTAAQRLKNLHLVVCNTRFLVLPRVPHLASHLLAANIRRLAGDWQARYGCAPALLETFVDTTRFAGTCYKAANWIHVGLTQGRGKYDRHTRREKTIKAVFLYPLRADFRQVLCRG
jgi:hypothetical protein